MNIIKQFEDSFLDILKESVNKLSYYENLNNIDITKDEMSNHVKAMLYFETYNKKANALIDYLKVVEEASNNCILHISQIISNLEKRNNDNLSTALKIKDEKIRAIKLNDEIQKKLLNNAKGALQSAEPSKDGYKMLFDSIDLLGQTLVKEVETDYSYNVERGNNLLKNTKSDLTNIHDKYSEKIKKEVTNAIDTLAKEELLFYSKFYETSSLTNNELWEGLIIDEEQPLPILRVGAIKDEKKIFNINQTYSIPYFIPFTNRDNLIVKNFPDKDAYSIEIANILLTRLLMSNDPGKMELHLVDHVNFGLNFRFFTDIDKSIKKLYTREEEVVQLFQSMYEEITTRIQNLLGSKYQTLAEFNKDKNANEGYKVIVIMNYPEGITDQAIRDLKGIMLNGPRVGIHTILLSNKETIDLKDEDEKLVNDFSLYQMAKKTSLIDLDEEIHPNFINSSKLEYETIRELVRKSNDKEQELFQDIVEYLNYKVTQKVEIVHLSDNLPDKKEWWTKKAIKTTKIPIGISPEKLIVNFEFSHQLGQNTSLLLGIPGSGKSVTLHNFIINSCIQYSPDELELYLIDFSGVEFNLYAQNKLPHAKVIAPEVEVEFALSVLRNIRQKAEERQELFRQKGLSEYPELREKYPDIKLPRIVLVVDEFHKFFQQSYSEESEAQKLLEIIVKEYRKFGINMLLATQNMSGDTLNVSASNEIGVRIAMKCNERTANQIFQDDNVKNALKLNKAGQGIYNSSYGSKESNIEFQGFYDDKEVLNNIVQSIYAFSKNQDFDQKERVYFNSKKKGELSKDATKFKYGKIKTLPKSFLIWIGESFTMSDEDVSIKLRRRNSENILIAGGEEDVALRIVFSTLISCIASHYKEVININLFNFLDEESEDVNTYLHNRKTLYDCEFIEFVNDSNLESKLSYLKNEIEERRNGNKKIDKHIINVITAPELSNLISRGDEYTLSESAETLQYLFEHGPVNGIFNIVQSDRFLSFKKYFGTESLNYFKHRIALQMTENESADLIGSYVANSLLNPLKPYTNNRAYYYDSNNILKINPYDYPETEWVENLLKEE